MYISPKVRKILKEWKLPKYENLQSVKICESMGIGKSGVRSGIKDGGTSRGGRALQSRYSILIKPPPHLFPPSIPPARLLPSSYPPIATMSYHSTTDLGACSPTVKLLVFRRVWPTRPSNPSYWSLHRKLYSSVTLAAAHAAIVSRSARRMHLACTRAQRITLAQRPQRGPNPGERKRNRNGGAPSKDKSDACFSPLPESAAAHTMAGGAVTDGMRTRQGQLRNVSRLVRDTTDSDVLDTAQ
ncbi:hypothetical protein GGX14DRAFT_404130 [Mycena pura]|uniref:Uncharacterized protein n=1 Tax=Mycena pura TaxID=153505 RepID=A0AAD6V1T8_9AGAR|nr:hypothetical protein GGX14DRAFT_404130 [Mycena pura]